jgi:hypothetical protein
MNAAPQQFGSPAQPNNGFNPQPKFGGGAPQFQNFGRPAAMNACAPRSGGLSPFLTFFSLICSFFTIMGMYAFPIGTAKSGKYKVGLPLFSYYKRMFKIGMGDFFDNLHNGFMATVMVIDLIVGILSFLILALALFLALGKQHTTALRASGAAAIFPIVGYLFNFILRFQLNGKKHYDGAMKFNFFPLFMMIVCIVVAAMSFSAAKSTENAGK